MELKCLVKTSHIKKEFENEKGNATRAV